MTKLDTYYVCYFVPGESILGHPEAWAPKQLPVHLPQGLLFRSGTMGLSGRVSSHCNLACQFALLATAKRVVGPREPSGAIGVNERRAELAVMHRPLAHRFATFNHRDALLC